MTSVAHKVLDVADQTPAWLNVYVMVGGLVLSFLQPLAALVTIAWGLLQIYLAIEKRWFRKPPKE